MKRAGIRTNLLAVWPFWAALLSGLFFITLQVTGIGFTHFPGDLGDGRLNLYFLEHGYKFVTGKLDSFWNAPFMYPEKDVVSYSDNLIGTMPLYAFFRFFTDSFTAYQGWFVLVVILNYSATYLFLSYVLKNRYAAALGAFIFAFSMALQSQMTHAQMFSRFAIPLSFLFATQFYHTLRIKFLLLTVISMVYQFYCGIYLGFLLMVPLLLFLIFTGWDKRRELRAKFTSRAWTLSFTASGINGIILLIPLVLPYYHRDIPMGNEHFQQVFDSLPRLGSYFFSQRGSLFWDFLNVRPNLKGAWWDRQLFPGIIAMAGFLFFLARTFTFKNQDKTLRIFALVSVVTFILFLRIGPFSLYRILLHIPGFDGMRSQARIINVILLFFSLGAGYLSGFLQSSFKKAPHSIVFLILLALLTADNYFYFNHIYHTPVAKSKVRTQPLENALKQIPNDAIFSYEPHVADESPVEYQLDAMLASQTGNYKTLNGYTATSPGSFTNYWFQINAEGRREWLNSTQTRIDTLYVIHRNFSVSRESHTPEQ